MRRFLLAAGTIAAIGSLAAPGVSGAQAPAQDSVTGFAATGFGRSMVEFTFDVRSGPSGENPTGSVRFDGVLIDLGELEVSCLTVSGNRASMIAVLPAGPPSTPAAVRISVEDSGAGTTDRLGWSFVTNLPAECPIPSEVLGVGISAGDVVVTDAAAQVPTRDSVTGDADGCLALRPPNPDDPLPPCGHGLDVTPNASSGPAGENPSGSVVFREHFGSPSTDFLGQAFVTCLSVTGHTAIIGFSGQTRFRGPEAGLIRIIDGGPAPGQDTYQFATVRYEPNPGPRTCSSFPAGFPYVTPVATNATGDLRVVDAPGSPTTKQHCKNDGWRAYGIFKSQGDCVSFVRRRAGQACVFERAAYGPAAFRVKYGRGAHERHAMRRCIRQRTAGLAP